MWYKNTSLKKSRPLLFPPAGQLKNNKFFKTLTTPGPIFWPGVFNTKKRLFFWAFKNRKKTENL